MVSINKTIYNSNRKLFTTKLYTHAFFTKRSTRELSLPVSHTSYASYYSLSIRLRLWEIAINYQLDFMEDCTTDLNVEHPLNYLYCQQ